jgi:hypothetical protein
MCYCGIVKEVGGGWGAKKMKTTTPSTLSSQVNMGLTHTMPMAMATILTMVDPSYAFPPSNDV